MSPSLLPLFRQCLSKVFDPCSKQGCLKMHLQEIFEMYPCLKLLTSDAIYAQRPLLEALQEYHCGLLRTNENTLCEVYERCFIDPRGVAERLGWVR